MTGRENHGGEAGVAEPAPRTSAMLRALPARSDADPLPLAELTAGLKNRALGMLMLLFAAPCMIPLPPGVPIVCAAMLLACGAHLVLGREALWLPGAVARRGVGRALLARVLDRAVPLAERIERRCRPRWAWATSRLGRAAVGVVVIVLALVLMLPIPFLGNLPPGAATVVMAVGLLERDGVVIVAGLVASAAALAVTSAMAWAALEGLGAVL